MIGQRIGSYSLIGDIGFGGMGAVYKAEDRRSGRIVAVKMLKDTLCERKAVERFLREGEILQKLESHPGMVTVYEVGCVEGRYFMAMEYVEGTTLAEWIRAQGRLSPEEAVEMALALCDVLAFVHRKGIVHRDIKPGHILRSVEGPIKLMDFGLAKDLDCSTITAADVMMGTFPYLSPEMIEGGPVDGRSDLYALGVVLYRCLTGQLPFDGDTPAAVIQKHLNEEPIPPGAWDPDLPPRLEALVLKLLEKDPEDRYASAAVLKEEVSKVLQEPDGTVEAPKKPSPFQGRLRGGHLLNWVGRGEEMRWLRDRIDGCITGSGGAVLIEGEAGMGKTRLGVEVLSYARSRSVQFFTGACVEARTEPYLPFVEVLRAIFHLRRSDPEVSSERKVQKALRERTSDRAGSSEGLRALLFPERDRAYAPDAEESAARRHLLFKAVYDLMVALSHRRPLILFLEDLHWADEVSLDLFDYIVRGIRGCRILLIGTYRPEDLMAGGPRSQRIRSMSSEGRCETLALRGLPPDEVSQMAQAMFRALHLPSDFLKRLYRVTEGNPFFVIESLHALSDDGAILPEEGGWRLTEGGRGETLRLSGHAQDLVRRRIHRLPKEERRVVDIAAVEGEHFSPDVISEVLGMRKVDLLRTLNELERTYGLIGHRSGGYGFQHAYIREALYEDLSGAYRAELHRLIGEATEARHGGDPGPVLFDLAYHFSSSLDTEKAIRYLQMAGDQAREVYANREALRYYEHALERIEAASDHRGLIPSLYEQVGDAALLMGDRDKALRVYQRSLDSTEDRTARADLYRRMALIYGDRVEVYQAAVHLQAAYDELGADLESLPGARVLRDTVHLYWDLFWKAPLLLVPMPLGSLNPVRCLDLCERALHFLEAADSPRDLARAHLTLAGHLESVQNPEAVRHFREALRISEALGDLHQAAEINYRLGSCLLDPDQEEVLRHLELSAEQYERIGRMDGVISSHLALAGHQMREKKDLGGAGLHVRKAEEAMRETSCGEVIYEQGYAPLMAFVHRAQGNVDTALRYLQTGLERVIAHGHTIRADRHLADLESLYWAMGEPGAFVTFCRDLRGRRGEEIERLPLRTWWLAPAAPSDRFSTVQFEETFREAHLSPGWAWEDPLRRCGYRILPDRGTVEITPGPEIGFCTRIVSAPRIGRSVVGEFAAEVKMIPHPDGAIGPGGLMVMKDEDHVIRFVRGMGHDDRGVTLGLKHQGHFDIVGRGMLSGPDTYFRIERSGDTFCALCSDDGRTWWSCGQVTASWEDPVEVGIFAERFYRWDCSLTENGREVYFQGFRISNDLSSPVPSPKRLKGGQAQTTSPPSPLRNGEGSSIPKPCVCVPPSLPGKGAGGLGRGPEDAGKNVQLARTPKGGRMNQEILSADRPVAPALLPHDQLSVLFEVSAAVSATLHLEELLHRTIDRMIALTGAERGMVVLMEEADNLRVAVARNMDRETIRETTPVYERLVRQVAGAGAPVISADALSDAALDSHESVVLRRVRSLLCLPLMCKGKAIGAICLDDRRKAGLFAPEDLGFYRALADQIAVAVENARLYERAQREVMDLRQELQATYRFPGLIGQSQAMQRVFHTLAKVIPTSTTVLIQGETGTGKELIARAIHYSGPRKDKPFVVQNCAAIPETLLESELFGHRKGAFSGAIENKEGLLEVADGGTLFLDEIVDMPYGMQGKLLRVLEDGEIRRLGETHSRHVEVRVISATSRDLKEALEERRFREDLYYRLHVVCVDLPRLRERREDIPLLVEHFLQESASQQGKTIPGVTKEAMSALMDYVWPGNVRELVNEVERAVVLAEEGGYIGLEVLSQSVRGGRVGGEGVEVQGGSLTGMVDHFKALRIREALSRHGGNVTQAAGELGMSRQSLNQMKRRLRRLGMDLEAQ